MSALLGEYVIDMVDSHVYAAWVQQMYMLSSAGLGFKELQTTGQNLFRKYFLKKFPHHRLLAIANLDNIRDLNGQATFLFAHRPMTPEERWTSSLCWYLSVPEYDPQWLMVDEQIHATNYLTTGKTQIEAVLR